MCAHRLLNLRKRTLQSPPAGRDGAGHSQTTAPRLSAVRPLSILFAGGRSRKGLEGTAIAQARDPLFPVVSAKATGGHDDGDQLLGEGWKMESKALFRDHEPGVVVLELGRSAGFATGVSMPFEVDCK